MVMRAFNGYLIVQGGGSGGAAPTQTAQPAPRAAATARQEAQRVDQAVRDQIREQIRAEIAGEAVPPAPPVPPAEARSFTIRGPNGELTTIGIPPANEMIPPQAVDISLAFFFTMAAIIIGLPLARAFARRMDRKTAGTAQVPGEVTAQLSQLNQAVDAIALEVERISEGQRFTTRLLSEQRDAVRQTLPSAAER